MSAPYEIGAAAAGRGIIFFVWGLAYNLIAWLAAPLMLAAAARRYGWRRAPWREYFGFCKLPSSKPVLWLHAVSVGEAAAATGIIRELSSPQYQWVLTHTTRAGGEWLRRHHPQATVCALPLDLRGCAQRFIRRVRPQVGIIMEAEYWHNLLVAARQNGVRLALANARLKRDSARKYRRIAPIMRRCVGAFDIILAQTRADAARLRCFGATTVITAGNLKFDAPAPPDDESDKTVAAMRGSRGVLVVAATRAGEEALLLDAMDAAFWRRYLVVLAPRHIERRGEIEALLAARGLRYAARSRGEAAADAQCYLADTMGEMARWYEACDVAIIGGSFLPYGGQNPIEAMRARRAAIMGPSVDNYADLARDAGRAGALLRAESAAAAVALAAALSDAERERVAAAAAEFCRRHTGAQAVTAAHIAKLMG